MIYRFKIKQIELYDKMIDFASYHKYETSDVLKEHFQLWCKEADIMTLICREELLLKENNYDTDWLSIIEKNIAKKSYENTRGFVDSESDQIMILIDPQGNKVEREISGKTLEKIRKMV